MIFKVELIWFGMKTHSVLPSLNLQRAHAPSNASTIPVVPCICITVPVFMLLSFWWCAIALFNKAHGFSAKAPLQRPCKASIYEVLPCGNVLFFVLAGYETFCDADCCVSIHVFFLGCCVDVSNITDCLKKSRTFFVRWLKIV